MADNDVSDDDSGNWYEEQRTIEDQGFEALVHVVARDAVTRAASALARLRGLQPLKPEIDDYELCLELRHRVLGEFTGVLQGDLDDLEGLLADCNIQIYRSETVHDDYTDADLESVYTWECACGQNFEATIGAILDGICRRCTECT
jgi:hypothetical protein